jgi:NTE family protein
VDQERLKTSVILSGGGANAAYEVGVLKALVNGECPVSHGQTIDPDIYAGSSAGAFNGAMLVSQAHLGSVSAVEYLEQSWLNAVAETSGRCGNGVFRFRMDFPRYLDTQCLQVRPFAPANELAEDAAFFMQDWLNRATHFVGSAESLERRTLELFDFTTIVSTEPLRELLHTIVSYSNIRASDKVFSVSATNWETGELKVFRNADMTDDAGPSVIMASGALPGIFPPVTIQGDTYLDGSILNNAPLSTAIEDGADILHVIYLDPDVRLIPDARLQNTVDTMDRMYAILLAAQFNADIETAKQVNRGVDIVTGKVGLEITLDSRAIVRAIGAISGRLPSQNRYRKLTIHRYHPDEDLGGVLGLLNFDRNRIEQIIEKGYIDTVNHDCDHSQCIVPSSDS